MKHLFSFLLLLTLAFFTHRTEAALHYSQDPTQTQNGATGDKPLALCMDEEFNISFLCDPDWDVQTQNNTLFIIMSYDPAVTMTIIRTESPFLIMEQMTSPVLKDWDQYGEGFQKESITFAGHPGIVVKAFSKEYPDVRLVDYYSIHKTHLYNVLFSINPKSEWEEYKFLIKKVKDSFKFIE